MSFKIEVEHTEPFGFQRATVYNRTQPVVNFVGRISPRSSLMSPKGDGRRSEVLAVPGLRLVQNMV
jgi:hypothetical protein